MVNQGIVCAGSDPNRFTFSPGALLLDAILPNTCMNPPNPAFLAGAGGFFADVTIHDLDAARWMIGEIVEVSAHGAALPDRGFAGIGDIDTAVVCSVSRTGRSE